MCSPLTIKIAKNSSILRSWSDKMKLIGVQMLFVSLLFVALFQSNKAWLFGGGEKDKNGNSKGGVSTLFVLSGS